MRAVKGVMLLAGVTAAVAVAVPAVAAETLRLGHNAAVGRPRDLSAQRFAELVKEKTGGAITVSFVPALTIR